MTVADLRYRPYLKLVLIYPLSTLKFDSRTK
jgi:hypothetical protein